MVNTQLLDDAIKRSGVKVTFICENLGISRNGFDKKRKGQIPFRISEVYVVSDILRLNDVEKQQIFFAEKVEE